MSLLAQTKFERVDSSRPLSWHSYMDTLCHWVTRRRHLSMVVHDSFHAKYHLGQGPEGSCCFLLVYVSARVTISVVTPHTHRQRS